MLEKVFLSYISDQFITRISEEYRHRDTILVVLLFSKNVRISWGKVA